MHPMLTRLRNAKLTYKLHLLGFLLVAIELIAAITNPSLKLLHQGLLFAASFAFAIGFTLWCEPVVRKVWEHPVAKLLVVIPHFVVLLFAAAISRNVVSSALGLPPQDFDLTVSLLTLAFYIPVWSLVVSIAVGVVALFLYLTGLLIGIFRRPFSESAKLFGQAAGALAICFYSSTIFGFANSHQESLHPIIKWVALFADYQAAPSYPGINPTERIRFHENGVVSSAAIQDNTVIIRVRQLEQDASR